MLAVDDIHTHDVLIVGGGPCGLAVAARLCESTPSSLFTDSEHQRYHWMKASSARQTSKPFKTSRRSHTASDRLVQGASCCSGLDIAVLDAHGGEWMSAWNERFKKLEIKYLRSPMFFHPDPRDRDGLRGYAWKEGRDDELKEIHGVIGKELSKHQRKQKMKKSGKSKQETTFLDERDRPDYFRPSTALFKSFCEDIAIRYDLADIVEKSKVNSIDYKPSECPDCPGVFTLQTSTGMKRARIVVFAAGAALNPALPSNCPFSDEGSITHALIPSYLSSNDKLLPPHMVQKISRRQRTNLLVVGGGLTSAQIADAALKRGVTKVYQIMRGPLKVKDFDMELGWVAKFKNHFLARYWSADSDEERLEMYKEARNGGSVNSEYHHILKMHISKGQVSLHEHTNITSASWNTGSQSWKVETSPELLDLPAFDHVIYATGFEINFEKIEAVQPLIKRYGIETVGGFPCLTHDLSWSDEVPFFVTGRLASLRMGPASPNLEGARMGAERIAWKVGELLGRGEPDTKGERRDSGYSSIDGRIEGVDFRRLGLGIENQFDVLDLGGSTSESDD
ncbi:putative fad binding domain protein [Botrytis fragariae]|uniref:L-ornithine N(5)-monooxygenase [NAD(P)H] n=1 Tax=Botrytis fragariae TaxID=1964551 RepID=A0A8H6EIV7_9HELO|nr:putative fad binding domain protein [Botrytis fragariae]KAF5873899.1 putative fad binding domain protein [Botrytis fragariae]